MARARLRGKKRFALKMRLLKPEVRKEIEGAQAANARDMADLARKWAPVGDYAGGGALRDSTKAIGESEGPVIRWRVVSGDAEAFYARFVEFGTAPSTVGQRVTNASGRSRKAGRTHPGTPAQPYFFPAYRALRKRMRGRLSRAFSRAKRKVFR